MKIAMFGHKRIPSREGGIEVVVQELSTRMAEKGHQVVCYNRRGHHVCGRQFDVPKTTEYQGVALREVPTVCVKGLAAATASFFSSFFTAFGPEQVVHIHGEGPALFCGIPRAFGKTVVVTVHGLDWQRDKWQHGPGARYIRRGEQAAVRHAHGLIVLSEAARQYFWDTYRRETVVIPNGMAPALPRKAREITRRYGLEPEGYVLYLGRLVPEKGVHTLIEAYRRISPVQKLVIAGGASDSREYVRRLKTLAGDHPGILFTGFVRGEVLEELYSNASVYVLPSRLEGMPLTLLEAMSHGCCCLVSDIPECTAVAAGAAALFRAGDASHLARELEALLGDPRERARRRQASAARSRQCRNWDAVTEQTLALYRELGGSP